ncbi:RagB/SusD family nutrient uptake outer membrane protein [Sediminibacterium sp.]|uniref:RagB/SusD family nutrient uptake outer membrane protein n=1 Tax=Sediminibacterium sp. TaxID=1917865 RepID=UPI0025ECAC51|nr:RagB/SusD family nutrient uptake outer membrane protein [Sediminibacterium sp.]MBT9485244.1 RagB/SusD family nutrient uptake outer membrane protein [Sediminibacterium sp.]
MKFTTKLIFIILLVATSCSKKLDLPPENILIESQVLANASSSEALLASAYFKTYVAVRNYYYMSADLSTGNAMALTTNGFVTLWNGNLIATSGLIQTLWNNHYSAINEANVIINLVPNASFSQSIKTQLVAEAKFVRALNYFFLVRDFGSGALTGNLSGPGVPLQLLHYSNYDPSKNIPRSTSQEVYTQILKDLNEAADNLTDLVTATPQVFRGRAQKTTCYALASRVALYMRDYSKAVSYSAQALTNKSQYILASSPALIFPVTTATSNIPFNAEFIFAFPTSYNSDLADNNLTGYYAKTALWPDPAFLATFSPNDIRNSASMMVVGNPTGPVTRVTPSKFANPLGRDHLPIIRVSEIYLNRAEALVKSTNTINTEAIGLLNSIRQRSFPTGLKPLPFTLASFATVTDLLNAILRERRWELAFEGHDKFDKIRNGIAPNVALTNQSKWVYPIPRREIDLTNGLITQNPGY